VFDFIKRERLVSGYLPLVGHMSDGVVLLDDGSVFAMLELAGLPWETCDRQNVSERQIRLNHTYRNIAA
jgi:type IV secretion system protein VirB4